MTEGILFWPREFPLLQDAAAALLGAQIHTDFLLLLTDAPAVYDPRSWPAKKEPVPSPITPDALRRLGNFASGSMGPKVSLPLSQSIIHITHGRRMPSHNVLSGNVCVCSLQPHSSAYAVLCWPYLQQKLCCSPPCQVHQIAQQICQGNVYKETCTSSQMSVNFLALHGTHAGQNQRRSTLQHGAVSCGCLKHVTSG